MIMSVKPCVKTIVELGRFLIPYRVYGHGGEILVCINGIQQSMAIWGEFVQRFSHNFTILLFDFPHQGKGRVAKGPSDVSLSEQVEILNNLIKAAGIKNKLTLISASWGGVVAASYAITHPQHIKRLILAGLGTRPNKKMVETITRGTKLPMQNRREIAETLISGFGQDLPLNVKAAIVSQFERMDPAALESFYRHGEFVLSAGPLSDVIDLKSINCKTILLRGENDTIIDSDDLDFLASEIPGAQVRTIKGAGHFLHLENDKLMDTYADILSS